MKPIYEEAGVMSLGLGALAAFLLVGAVATLLGMRWGSAAEAAPIPNDAAAAALPLPEADRGPRRTGMLPDVIRESSGVARSRRHRDVWWTHNDGDDGRVFAFAENGTLLATWRLAGVALEDVEDIASGPCPDDETKPCLYLADTGDNDRDRSQYAIYVVEEPDLLAGETDGLLRRVAVQRFTYGAGSRDAEALALLPDGDVLVITKGQEEGAELFRLPRLTRQLPGAPATTTTAQSLGMLPIDVDRKRNRVTAAAISPSGTRLAVRSDVGVRLFDWPVERQLARCDIDGGGRQGEGVDFIDESTLLLTFEAARGGRAPIVRLPCGGSAAPAAGMVSPTAAR